jgi:hypothetical protein
MTMHTDSGVSYREMSRRLYHLAETVRENVETEKRVAGLLALTYSRTYAGASLPIGMVVTVTRARTVWADELEARKLFSEADHMVTFADGY